MIVCVCHNVNEKRIASCVGEGVRTVKGMCMATRAGTQCGKCLPTAKGVLKDALREVGQDTQALSRSA